VAHRCITFEEYEWKTEIWPALRKARLVLLVEKCGKRLSRRALIEARAGRSMPHKKNREFIESVLKALGLLSANARALSHSRKTIALKLCKIGQFRSLLSPIPSTRVWDSGYGRKKGTTPLGTLSSWQQMLSAVTTPETEVLS
jgi:hypothetical protein